MEENKTKKDAVIAGLCAAMVWYDEIGQFNTSYQPNRATRRAKKGKSPTNRRNKYGSPFKPE